MLLLTNFSTTVYGWIQQDEDGNYIPQETITVDEDNTVILTIGYHKGGSSSSLPLRQFQITTSGSAGMREMTTSDSEFTPSCFLPFLLCAGSSDYFLNSSTMQTLSTGPTPFTVLVLNDGIPAESEETLTLTLTEVLDRDRHPHEFLLGTVNIRIRDINSMYSTQHGV